MSSVVLDASALIAVLRGEDGADTIKPHLHGALISSVNLSEVFYKTIDKGGTMEAARWMVESLPVVSVVFDDEQAAIAASIHKTTLRQGISFADRACLALSISRQLPVLTSDRQWKKLKLDVQIEVFR